jgi:hypothetical protein
VIIYVVELTCSTVRLVQSAVLQQTDVRSQLTLIYRLDVGVCRIIITRVGLEEVEVVLVVVLVDVGAVAVSVYVVVGSKMEVVVGHRWARQE